MLPPGLHGIEQMRISIPSGIFEQMIAHCRSCLPDEGCGILAGTGTQVTRMFPAKNIDPSPTNYLMDPQEQFHIMKIIRASNIEILAIYHSHPDSLPHPSEKDIQLAYYAEVAYVIVSFRENMPIVCGYRIASGVVHSMEIRNG